MNRTAFASICSALGLMAGLTSAQAFALPLAATHDGAHLAAAPSDSALAATGVDFTAIIALSNCSGSLVRFNTSNDGDKAMVLTNGHCYEGGFINAGTIVLDHASTRTFRLLSSNGQATLATLRAARVMYATMTDTDVTLYRLTNTFAEIKASYGVDALVISDQRPAAGAPIRIVSGYWKRIYSCAIDDFVNTLKEDQWTFSDSIRFSTPGCETIGGTSGSPIIHADSHEVIGINNTGNEDGERCTMNNPCEVDGQGQVTVRHGASYGQQLYKFYGCLDATNNINLATDGCDLPKNQ